MLYSVRAEVDVAEPFRIPVTSLSPKLFGVTVARETVGGVVPVLFAPVKVNGEPATVEVISRLVVFVTAVSIFLSVPAVISASISVFRAVAALPVAPTVAVIVVPLILTVTVSPVAPADIVIRDTCSTEPPLSRPKLAAERFFWFESYQTEKLRPSEVNVTPLPLSSAVTPC